MSLSVVDYEQGRADKLTENVWLTDDTVSMESWCYTKDLEIKSADIVLDTFIDIISKNGCLLLNISPKADGTIPEDQRKVLLRMGQWLRKFGEAVYGTRPWIVYGEGPTRMAKGGHFLKVHAHKAEDVRFTSKPGVVYAIMLGWPGAEREVVIRSFAPDSLKGEIGVKGVSFIGSSERIKWKLRKEGLAITTPSVAPDDLAVVVKIDIEGMKDEP